MNNFQLKTYIPSFHLYENETIKGKYTFEDLEKIVLSDSKLDKIRKLLDIAKETEQNPEHHPEDSVYHHIKAVTNRLANHQYNRREVESNMHINLPLSGFFHDLGKAVDGVTQLNLKRQGETFNGKRYFSSHGHEKYSAELVDEFKDWIDSLGGDPDVVHHLVLNHMRIGNYLDRKMKKRSKRRQMSSDPYIKDLIKFHKQDQGGDDPTPRTKFYD